MRLRILFAKTDAMRFTSHLDLYRTWERTLRRAGLPLAYSQGYNPHPRINLASALPLGFTSQGEVLDVWLKDELPPNQVERDLKVSLPPGIMILSVEQVGDKEPPLQTILEAAEFEISFPEPAPYLDEKIQELLASSSLSRQRRGKTYDLRPLLLDLQRLPDDASGKPRLFMRLAAREGATGRPEEVILALGFQPLSTRINRTRLILGKP